MDLYDWERFWIPREAPVDLSDGGYLVDPNSEFGKYTKTSAVPFVSMLSTPCLVLLGEPGLGKSTVLEQEYERAKAQAIATGDRVVNFDLRGYQTDSELHRDIFEARALREWRDGEGRLHLFFDSLDECRLRIDNIASILVRELKSLEPVVGRLCLRVACRTADWSHLFESELQRIYGPDSMAVRELAPLTRAAVRVAATARLGSSDQFIAAVNKHGAVPLAIKPITLRFLLDIFCAEGGLPSTRFELYRIGCRHLAAENNPSRIESKTHLPLDAQKRTAIAMRIAAVTVFCDKYAIWDGPDSETPPAGDVTYADLSGGAEGTGNAEVRVDQGAMKEVVDSGLFTSRGRSRMGWAHQTYAEFHAALYLLSNNMPTRTILLLVLQNGKVTPQLREVTAWLASGRVAIFRKIARADPAVLLRTDIEAASAKDRKRLVKYLLDHYEKSRLLDLYNEHRYYYRKLDHPGLDRQLRSYITDKRRNPIARRSAIEIAEDCRVRSLWDGLVEIALDGTEQHELRVAAACAVSRTGNAEAKGRLKPLAVGQAGSDPDDELRGCGLECCWPVFMTASELFAGLRPPKRHNLIGLYWRFLHSDITRHLKPIDMPVALEWALLSTAIGQAPDPIALLADSIVAQALDHLDILAVRDAMRATFPVVAKLSMWKGHNESALRRKLDASPGVRQGLMRLVVPVVPDEHVLVFLLHESGLVKPGDDVYWLIQLADEGACRSGTIAEVVDRCLDRGDPEQLDAVISACQRNPEFAKRFAWFFEVVEISSQRANELRGEFRRHIEEMTSAPAPVPALPPTMQRVTTQLEAFEGGDLNAFLLLNLELARGSEIQSDGRFDEPDLTALPGWSQIDNDAKDRVFRAAARYLEEFNPDIGPLLTESQTTYEVFSGYRALISLFNLDCTFGSQCARLTIEKWAPVVLAVGMFGTVSNVQAKHKELMQEVYAVVPDAMIKAALSMVDSESARFDNLFILERLEQLWDGRLADALSQKLHDSSLKTNAFRVLLGTLLRHGVQAADDWSKSALRWPLPTDGMSRQRSVSAGCELIVNSPEIGWNLVWSIAKKDPDFGQVVFVSVANSTDARAKVAYNRLTEHELADLFVWAARRAKPNEGPNVRDHAVAPWGWWGFGFLEELKNRGTTAACESIRDVVSQLPQYDWLKWHLREAEEIAISRGWVPLEPRQLLDLVNPAATGKTVPRPEALRQRWTPWVPARVVSTLLILVPVVAALYTGVHYVKEVSETTSWIRELPVVRSLLPDRDIPGGTGWLMAGRYDPKQSRITAPALTILSTPPPPDPLRLPQLGDTVKLLAGQEVIIVEYRNSGLKQAFTCPRSEQPGPSDRTGVTLPTSTELRIQDVRRDNSHAGLQPVWVRVSRAQ